jgi:tRNA A37 threonylcarbamoyladenosine synthetase subunit TsaC/SUA5/YrdC
VLAALGPGVDLVLDGGPTPGGPASTVLDVTGVTAVLLRPGVIVLAPEDLEG